MREYPWSCCQLSAVSSQPSATRFEKRGRGLSQFCILLPECCLLISKTRRSRDRDLQWKVVNACFFSKHFAPCVGAPLGVPSGRASPAPTRQVWLRLRRATSFESSGSNENFKHVPPLLCLPPTAYRLLLTAHHGWNPAQRDGASPNEAIGEYAKS